MTKSNEAPRGFEAVLEKLQGGVDGYRERMAESFEKMGPELAQSIGLECFVWLTLVADHLGIKDGDDPGSLGYACLRAIDERLGASNSNGDATLLNQYRDRCERYAGELDAALQALGQIQGKVCPDEVMPARDGAILTELMEAKAALRGRLNISASHYIDQAISLITKETPRSKGDSSVEE